MFPYDWQKKAITFYKEKILGMFNKHTDVMQYKTQVKGMQWQDNSNYIDCGVFCMGTWKLIRGNITATGIHC